jgi:serine protease Do
VAVLQELETAIAGVVTATSPATVTVGRGSGVVVAPGIVVTNAHNVAEDEVTVTFADGNRASGTVRGVDVDGDLAAVSVDTGDITPVAWTDDGPAVGRVVVALARPGRRGLVATVGTVAAIQARFRGPRGGLVSGAFEHDARVPRGGSGGPVVDLNGRLVGIDTHRRRDGFYVAQPATVELRERVDALARGEVRERPRLGIAVAPPHVARRLRIAVGLTPRDGVLVRGVTPDSPAARAGVDEGDLIVTADGAAITAVDDLHVAVAGASDRVRLTVVRGDEERDVVIDLSGDATDPD